MADFSFSLARLVMANRDISLSLWDIRSSDIAGSRNRAVRMALAGDYTHLMFLDSDMAFPANTLKRLLEHGKPVVGATYIRRAAPYDLLGTMAEKWANKPLVEALEMPTGCLLINCAVLRRMSWPWFKFEDGEVAGDQVSEDVYFSRKVREGGGKMWCDALLTREVSHVGVKAYTVQDGIEHIKKQLEPK